MEEIREIKDPKVVYALSYGEGRELLSDVNAVKKHGKLNSDVCIQVLNMFISKNLADGINRPYLVVEGYAKKCLGNFYENIVGLTFENDNVSNAFVRMKYNFSNEELSDLCELGLFEEDFTFPTKVEDPIYAPLDVNYTVISKDGNDFILAEIDHTKQNVISEDEVDFVRELLDDKELFQYDMPIYLNSSLEEDRDYNYSGKEIDELFDGLDIGDVKETHIEDEYVPDEQDVIQEKMKEDSITGAFYRVKADYDSIEEDKKKKKVMDQIVIEDSKKAVEKEQFEDFSAYNNDDDGLEL